MHELTGTFVLLNGELWYVDNDDEGKDDGEETYLYVLPAEFVTQFETFTQLLMSAEYEEIGYWVRVSEVTPTGRKPNLREL